MDSKNKRNNSTKPKVKGAIKPIKPGSLFTFFERMSSNKIGSLFIGISLFLITVIFFSLLLEAGSRVVLKPDMDRWFVGPSHNDEKMIEAHLEQGTKHRQPFLLKDTSKITILGLGDSFTFGLGVYDVNNTHLVQTEKKLNAIGVPVIINNVARPGNNILEILSSSQTFMKRLKPDIVLYSIFLNDPALPNSATYKTVSINLLPYVGNFLSSRSYFYFYINSKFKSLVQNLFYPDLTREQHYNLYSEDNLKNYEYYLLKLKEYVEESGAELVASILPLMDNFENYQYLEQHEKLKTILTKNSIEHVDLLPYFSQFKNPKDLWVNPYDSHPNEIAHERFAEGQKEFLSKLIIDKYSNKLASLPQEGKIIKFPISTAYVRVEGRTLYFQKKYDEAIALFKQDLELDPNNNLLYNWIGGSYAEKKEYKKALEYFDKALEVKDDYIKTYHNKANIHAIVNEPDKAISVLNSSLEKNDKIHETYKLLSTLYARKREFVVALEMIQNAIDINPVIVEYHLTKAQIYLDLNNPEKADLTFDDILALDNSNIDAKIGKGRILTDKNILDEASVYFNEVVTIQPDQGNAHAWLSYIYYKKQQYDLALKEIEIAEKSPQIIIDKQYLDELIRLMPRPKSKN